MTAGGAITATGGVNSSGSTTTLSANGGAIDLGALTESDADLTATGAVSADEAAIGGLLTVEGSSVTAASAGNLTIYATATDGNIDVASDRALTAPSASATGDILLSSNISRLMVNAADANNIDLRSRTSQVVIEGVVDALGAFSVTALGSFVATDGTALADTIEVFSGDVQLGSDSVIGDATRTQSVTFAFANVGVLGGDPQPTETWALDNTELARVFSAGDIRIDAMFGEDPTSTLLIGDITLIAGEGSSATGQNIGQSGGLILRGQGDIDIGGDVSITNATLDTLLQIEAEDLVQLDPASGGLFVLDANEGLSGLIAIRATDFIAATDSAVADIAGLTVAEIDPRLENSDGVDRPDGVIRADTLDIATTTSQVFIQNTVPGTDFDDRRGFDVNALSISSGGGTGSTQPIVINGVLGGVTGIDTIAQTSISSVPDLDSTINGCVIADPASCTGVAPPPSPPPPGPGEGGELGESTEVETRDLIDDGLTPPEVQSQEFLQGGLIENRPETAFEDDPLIDDPVTGAGNEDLWVDEDALIEEEAPEDVEPEKEDAES
ncbi:MAG: hypothetical protein HRT64_02415 [Erythrobacter sp.]|nr:hypothetical protein [Erythrobacter sp.]